jgi:AhpD family alkylhydroperoxidase
MDANATYAEIKQMLGLVPGFLKLVPQEDVAREWALFKRIELDEGVIPNKYRELIGLGIAAATHCRYCSLFHTEAAKLFGATQEEIEAAVRYAKNSSGWSTYLNGMQVDHDAFRKEVAQIVAHVSAQQGGGAGKGANGKRDTQRLQ